MKAEALPIPNHFDPDAVDEIRRVPYEDLAQSAVKWAAEHQIQPASEDESRICLVAVDVQNTFCIPEFELYVGGRSGTGAVDDNRRLCEFIYRNLHLITQVVPTMDTHQAMQIFHSIFFIDENGRHPAPATLITQEDIVQERWRFNDALSQNLKRGAEDVRQHLVHYTSQLKDRGKYELTVWPYHAMLGGIGHAIVPAVEEAIFFHTIARYSQPDIHIKGNHPLTEHYSVFGPEVATDSANKVLVQKDEGLFRKLVDFDAILVAGQAKSHCVAWTISDLMENILLHDKCLVEKVYLLEDCTSAVVIPGVLDYTDEADAAFHRFREAGMHVVRATEPMRNWPGIFQKAGS
jgi:nicotinamidase-related amidase